MRNKGWGDALFAAKGVISNARNQPAALAQQPRPLGTCAVKQIAIADQLSLIEQRVKYAAIANRPDGLGARLCAVFNALLVSELTKCRFAFTWPESYVKTDSFHAVPEVERLFDEEFIENYYIEPFAAESQSAVALSLPPRYSMEQMKQHLLGTLEKGHMSLPWNPLLRSMQISKEERITLVEQVSKRMQLSQTLREVRRRANAVSLPPKATALHLRAGDIVYGRFAENPHFAGKTIPVPLANLIIQQDRSKTNFVIFGQEPEFAASLAERGQAIDAAELLEDLNSCKLSSALKDVFLIARCTGYYAGSSGFTAFADNIGRCKHLRWDLLRTKNEWALLILDEVENNLDAYTSQQAAFACFFAYGCLDGSLHFEERMRALRMARCLSPSNRLYGLLQALHAYDQSLWDSAEATLSELSTSLGTDLKTMLESREMRRLLLSRSSGKHPYELHMKGLRAAVEHGCSSAKVLLPVISGNS
jgi:hypothetical protein